MIETDSLDDGIQVLSFSSDVGLAYCARNTGAFVAKLSSSKRDVTSIKDPTEAINLALDHVAKKNLITLHEHESLDVIAVSSTRYAGWTKKDDAFEPVYFESDKLDGPVTHYKSEYKVVFGRRYRGIPIIGETLRVVLDSEGEISAFVNPWRDIIGESDSAVELIPEQEATESVSQDMLNGIEAELISKKCGYFESFAVGINQESPGIGCRFVFENPRSVGTLAEQFSKEISLVADGTIPLQGEEIDFEIPQNEVEIVEDNPN